MHVHDTQTSHCYVTVLLRRRLHVSWCSLVLVPEHGGYQRKIGEIVNTYHIMEFRLAVDSVLEELFCHISQLVRQGAAV